MADAKEYPLSIISPVSPTRPSPFDSDSKKLTPPMDQVATVLEEIGAERATIDRYHRFNKDLEDVERAHKKLKSEMLGSGVMKSVKVGKKVEKGQKS